LTPEQKAYIVSIVNWYSKKDTDMTWYRLQHAKERRKRLGNDQKKRQLMRESDFLKLPKRITEKYDVSFKPFTRDYFERRTTWFYLKGKKYIGDQFALYEYPKDLLKRMTGVHWHNTSQQTWLYKYNELGELVVRAGLRQPESRFGLATFRKK
jgi:hypothetical protein